MITQRQVERLWNQGEFRRLFTILAAGRAEFPCDVVAELAGFPLASAALAVLRLSELGQTRTPIFGRLAHFVLAQRNAELLWADVPLSALAVRALRAVPTASSLADLSCHALADLQKDDGAFPAQPIKRLTGDPVSTALVVALLGDDAVFPSLIELDAALAWLARSAPSTLRSLVRVAGFRGQRAA